MIVNWECSTESDITDIKRKKLKKNKLISAQKIQKSRYFFLKNII